MRQNVGVRQWKPGQSGNPSGRPKKDPRIVKIADDWTEKSVETLVEIMTDPSARNSDRRECARLLPAYAHGHPCAMREVELNASLQALKEINEGIDRSTALTQAPKQSGEFVLQYLPQLSPSAIGMTFSD